MDLVFLGTNDAGLRIYEWLCERDDVSVKALVTEPEQLELVHTIDPDLLLSVGFAHLVPAEILAVPERGSLNLHPSLLPYNRGANPNVWSLIEGTPAGVTLHYMDEEFDTGPIVAQREVDTDFADTGKDLHRRLEDAQFDLFTEVWPDIVANEVEPTPQEGGEGTYHTTDDFREACELDPDETVRVEDFLNRLRALTFPPFDNATIEIDGKQYYVDVEIRSADEKSDEKSAGLISSY
jgi:methionyl-tRNA formyltransferase